MTQAVAEHIKGKLVVCIADIGTQLTRSRPKTSGPAMTPPLWSSRRRWWRWQQQPTASREQHAEVPAVATELGFSMTRLRRTARETYLGCTTPRHVHHIAIGGLVTAGLGTASGAACGRYYLRWSWTTCWWGSPSRQPAGKLMGCAGVGLSMDGYARHPLRDGSRGCSVE